MRRWIKNLIILTSLLLVSCTPPSSPPNSPSPLDLVQATDTIEVKNSFGEILEVLDAPHLTLAEQRARKAAVKVRSLLKDGHGSGTYMVAYNRRVVITAAHVVRNDTIMLIEARDGEAVTGRVVFKDNDSDIAVILVPEIKSRTAVPFRPELRYDDRLVGAQLTYTGFPSHHDLLTIRGYVAALEQNMIVANMFGWFGSSGAGVFDHKGRLTGVVSGIDVGRYWRSTPLEVIVWVAPLSSIDQEMLKIRILSADPVGTINAFPGAPAPRRGEAIP